MTVFDNLEDALEEAQFCASTEKRKYIVRQKYSRFQVYPKYRKGKEKPGLIEIGFKGSK